ncbi:MAG: tetratricopeptide repeat protein [Leptospirillia bacterium]
MNKRFEKAARNHREGRLKEAEKGYLAVLKANPGHGDAHFRLGMMYASNKRLVKAARHLKAAVKALPDLADGWYNLGVVHYMAGELADAETALRRTVALNPEAIHAWGNLGVVLDQQQRYAEAAEVLAEALEKKPDAVEVRVNLANVLKRRGRFKEAEEHYGKALSIRPGNDLAASNYLFLSLYDPEQSAEGIFARHRDWGIRRVAGRPAPPQFENTPDPERTLKVGYLSPDFRRHPVAAFLTPVFPHHDPSAVEAFCYANVAKPDQVTATLKAAVPHWRDVQGLPPTEIATRIRADDIDILVDLAGHTAGNQAAVLAEKPAPVQVTYLGYPASTGLPTVDWRITDPVADPAGNERFHVERLARIEGGFSCFAPSPEAPPIGPPPSTSNGFITFGSLMNTIKINDRVIALWARVLAALPGARLSLCRKTFDSDVERERYLAAFESHGIERERVSCFAKVGSSDREFLDTYNTIDISLDTFPYAGHTTSCEALWMGVPIVTLNGEHFHQRVGASLLTTLGLTDLIADTQDQFVGIAVGLATDPARLAEMRAGMRKRMQDSPLLDGEGFTRKLEAAYRDMWRDWCERQAAS